MIRRTLGRSGLQVGSIGIGCWAIGGPFENLGLAAGWDGLDKEAARDGIAEALRLGANLFDTADVYGLGTSEQLVGAGIARAIAEGRRREEFVVVSKVGYDVGDAKHGFAKGHIERQLEMSLRNLRLDYLDVYFLHHLDFGSSDEWLDGAVETMRRVRSSGLVRFIGLRGPHKFSPLRQLGAGNYDDRQRFGQIVSRLRPDIISIRFNMLTPLQPTMDLLEGASADGIGVLIYKPLAQGLLLDKYDPASPPSFGSGDNRSRKAWFRGDKLAIIRKRLDALKGEFGCVTPGDLARLAVRYCLGRCKDACVVVGFRSEGQVRETFADDRPLSKTECQRVEAIFAGVREELGGFYGPGGTG